MTQEALKLALDFVETVHVGEWVGSIERQLEVITAIKEALAQPEQEPVKIAHRHEWFRTGEMKVGQMRCISCGTWGQEEITQRTWVGLTSEEVANYWDWEDFQCGCGRGTLLKMVRDIEAKLKERNT